MYVCMCERGVLSVSVCVVCVCVYVVWCVYVCMCERGVFSVCVCVRAEGSV